MPPAGLLLCLCFSFGGAPASGSGAGARFDAWLGEDKLTHFVASFAATTFAASGARLAGLDDSRSIRVGAGVGVGVGVAKEIHDLHHPEHSASWRDLAWDLAGVGTGVLVLRRGR